MQAGSQGALMYQALVPAAVGGLLGFGTKAIAADTIDDTRGGEAHFQAELQCLGVAAIEVSAAEESFEDALEQAVAGALARDAALEAEALHFRAEARQDR